MLLEKEPHNAFSLVNKEAWGGRLYKRWQNLFRPTDSQQGALTHAPCVHVQIVARVKRHLEACEPQFRDTAVVDSAVGAV